MGRVKFLSISLLGFLFPNAGFPRVESEQQQASSAEGIIPPPLSCLGIGFWYMFRPIFLRVFRTQFLFRHRILTPEKYLEEFL